MVPLRLFANRARDRQPHELPDVRRHRDLKPTGIKLSEQRSRVIKVVLLCLPVHILIAALTWHDVSHRRADQVRGSKRLWRLASALNTLGAVAYWLAGTTRDIAANRRSLRRCRSRPDPKLRSKPVSPTKPAPRQQEGRRIALALAALPHLSLLLDDARCGRGPGRRCGKASASASPRASGRVPIRSWRA
jgi:hypothetical protein